MHGPGAGPVRGEQTGQVGAVTWGWSSAYPPSQPGREKRQPSVDGRNAGSGPWPAGSRREYTHTKLSALKPKAESSAPHCPHRICTLDLSPFSGLVV